MIIYNCMVFNINKLLKLHIDVCIWVKNIETGGIPFHLLFFLFLLNIDICILWYDIHVKSWTLHSDIILIYFYIYVPKIFPLALFAGMTILYYV